VRPLTRKTPRADWCEVVNTLSRLPHLPPRVTVILECLHAVTTMLKAFAKPHVSSFQPGGIMSQRINYIQQSPELFKKFLEFSNLLKDSAIEEAIRDLVSIRASQLNGCAFCLDMHVKEAKIHGERELRIHHLPAWRESTLFGPRERAALAWTEVLTKLPEQGVPDDIYERVRTQFSEKELSDLTFDVMAINAWNRVNVAFRTVPGSADKAYGLDKANLS
jgi:AhpD family alkylhydroperoxidase